MQEAVITYALKQLKVNVEKALVGLNVEIKFDKGRMFIDLHEDNFDKVSEALKNVFGIHEYNIAYKLSTREPDEIGEAVLELVKDIEFNTFKVVTKRSDKKFPLDSMEFSRKMGGVILKGLGNKNVDVHNPDETLQIELRNKYTYLYLSNIKGMGGFPVGVAGRGLLMLSGGIDSPVAGYLAMKRGIKLECLYFESPPHTSMMARNKVKDLVKKLTKDFNSSRSLLVLAAASIFCKTVLLCLIASLDNLTSLCLTLTSFNFFFNSSQRYLKVGIVMLSATMIVDLRIYITITF